MRMNIQLFRIEKNMKQVATMHSLGKMPVKEAKKEILRLSKEFNDILLRLPESERSLYQRKRVVV